MARAPRKKAGSVGPDTAKHIQDGIEKTIMMDFTIHQDFYLKQSHKLLYTKIHETSTNLVFVDGPSGSCKTYLGSLCGLEMLRDRKVEQIIYIRSAVESASRPLGSLPGEVNEKFLPYSMPLVEKINELVDRATCNQLFNKEFIKTIPVNFVRGLTFHNSYVIVDEAQNMDFSEITTILTRFGKNSKFVVLGDSKQADIGNKSCMPKIYNLFDDELSQQNGIHCFKLTNLDIVRSKILKFITSKLEVSER